MSLNFRTWQFYLLSLKGFPCDVKTSCLEVRIKATFKSWTAIQRGILVLGHEGEIALAGQVNLFSANFLSERWSNVR